MQKTLDRQKTEAERRDKNVCNWKYIEIVNDSSIKELFNFVHPAYGTQYFFFSSDHSMMIERGVFYKAYLYVKVPVVGTENTIKW